jgi:hypothetical protein
MTFLAAIAFDPAIRGVLVVMVGVVVLLGSVYLLLATNTGARGGFLIAMAALTGWLFSLGLFWTMYGIGMVGRTPTWTEKEVNFDRSVAAVTPNVDKLPDSDPQSGTLPTPAELLAEYEERNPEVREQIAATEGPDFEPESLTQVVTLVPELKVELQDQLNGWKILPESDPRRGEAVASADAALAEGLVFGQNTGPASYTVKDVFIFGGKTAAQPEDIPGERNLFEKAWNRIVTTVEVKNPPQYAAITLQKNVEQVVAPGEAPPPAQIDESASTVTVIFQRNLGNRRLVPFLFAMFNGVLFFVFIWMLHTRDKRIWKMREEWDATKALEAG